MMMMVRMMATMKTKDAVEVEEDNVAVGEGD